MIYSNSLKDYILLDAGDKEKLESWNGIILSRPDPMALWPKSKKDLWNRVDGHYERSNKGGGRWHFNKKLPEYWTIDYKDNITFKISPTNFKHTGLFPEQAANWDFIYEKISNSDIKDIRILNLFAYSGAASIVASKAGAKEVVHVDASKGMNAWAKENQKLSHLENNIIRYLQDDCLKFLLREKRRGRTYHGIIMDPPSYGRGPDNEIFKFEDKINPLIDACLDILDDNHLFYIINTYTTGYSPVVMHNVLEKNLEKHNLNGNIITDEIGIQIKDSNIFLPCGQTSRYYK